MTTHEIKIDGSEFNDVGLYCDDCKWSAWLEPDRGDAMTLAALLALASTHNAEVPA